jgi:hypothetical protein
VQRELGESLRQSCKSEAQEGAPVEKQLGWILERDDLARKQTARLRTSDLVETSLPDVELAPKQIPGRPSEKGGDQVPSLAM